MSRFLSHRALWLAVVLSTVATLTLFDVHTPGADTPTAPALPERLTSRPRAEVPTTATLKVGEEVRTAEKERRRVALPDGSILMLNEGTAAKLEAVNRLTLSSGEVLLTARSDVRIKTPKREVSGKDATFAIRAEKAGVGVVVTRGKVSVEGMDAPLTAGLQLTPGQDKPTAAPRAAHALDWTRDLMAAAESPLVPGSKHAGGALIAIDPEGQEAKISLRKYHVDVHIEDGFARTTIDQTYFNHENARLEGTFYFPLPPDASLSRLAMYVDGNLMEGGMAERDYARSVYETIRYRQRDPALLEWVDGSTFKMRVFPMEARQEKRILLAYTQKLPVSYSRTSYRFPAGHSLQVVREWSFEARVKGGADLAWQSDSHKLGAKKDKGDLLLTAEAKDAKVDRDVVLSFDEPTEESIARFSSSEADGTKYLMLRYRPPSMGVTERRQRDWVFLFESSGDRDPLLARVQIDVISGLLAHAEPGDTFTVLSANTRVSSFSPQGRPVTPENVQAAVAWLEKAHLIGALDLGRALSAAEPVLKGAKSPHLVHVGSGIAAMGERRDEVLAKSLPAGTHYVGIGVGRRWNRSFMKQAAEKTGGHFTQINPDESIGWRAFDLASTLNTERMLDIRVADAADNGAFLTLTNAVAHGDEICAVTRVLADQPLPEKVKISGIVAGKPVEREVPVANAAEKADYLPRTWAKLEIERLLALDPIKHKDAIVGLSKAMYVMTPFTSLLVLENEEMYEQYKVDRGRKDHWAIYPAPQKIQVVTEPDPDQPRDTTVGKPKPSVQKVAETVLARSIRHDGRVDAKRFREAADEPPIQFPPTATWSEIRSRGERMLRNRLNDVEVADGVSNTLLGGEAWGRLGDKQRYLGLARAAQPIAHAQQVIFNNRTIPDSLDPKPESDPASVVDAVLSDSAVVLKQGEEFRRVEEVHRLIARMKDAKERSPGEVAGGKQFLAPPTGNEEDAKLDPAALGRRILADSADSLSYRRPEFSGDDRHFSDLVGYAPGMEMMLADVRGVLEAEAAPSPRSRPGKIDPAAARLIDKARTAGWQSFQTGDVRIVFDGTGRYAWERTLPPGLREQVVCDGKTILHLYPDLGIGARRTVSRFHRADFAELVPWAVPPAEDFAHGADLQILGERTVVVIPHKRAKQTDGKAKSIRLHLVFAADGRLAERKLIEVPGDKVLLRETFSADGVIKVLDGDGKELVVRQGKLGEAKAPELSPDTKKLVVLPLPYRTRQHVLDSLKIAGKGYDTLKFDQALALFAADFAAADTSNGWEVFRQAFGERNQRHIGFYVLLASMGMNLDAEHGDVLSDHLDEPLAQYLALYSSPVLRKHASQWAVSTAQWKEGFQQHLALTHALYQRWQGEQAEKAKPETKPAERERALDYIRKQTGTVFAWGLLCRMADRAGKDEGFHRGLAEGFALFARTPGYQHAARYEQARSLWKGGKADEARKLFRDLYEETLKNDALPFIDSDFRSALLGDGTDADEWSDLLKKTSDRLIEKKQRPAVLALARQVWALGDEPRAQRLLTVAREGIADGKESVAMTLAVIEFLGQHGHAAEGDDLLQGLMKDKEQAQNPSLWRLAAQLAEKREMKARELACLERALELEYAKLPDVINLEAVRTDYGRVLDHYENLAESMAALGVKPPADFLPKVVRMADRWRSLDPESERSCRTVGRVLQSLGERDLVWDYLTTPVAMHPNESGSWLGLGQTLARQGELDLADRAYRAAFEAEPTNAQILWDRAQNLKQAGKLTEARSVFKQIADGNWQPRFRWLKDQAKTAATGQ